MSYELRLYEDGKLDPISTRNFRELHEAMRDLNGELGRSRVYAATIQGGGSFTCWYWNGESVLQVNGPWALSAAEARELKMINGHLQGLPRGFQKMRGAAALIVLILIAIGGGVVILADRALLPGPDGCLWGTFETDRALNPFGPMLPIENFPLTGNIRRFRVCLSPLEPDASGWPRWQVMEWTEVPRLVIRSWREVYKVFRPPEIIVDPASMFTPIEKHDGSAAVGVMREDAVTIGMNTRGLSYRPGYPEWQIRRLALDSLGPDKRPKVSATESFFFCPIQPGFLICFLKGRNFSMYGK